MSGLLNRGIAIVIELTCAFLAIDLIFQGISYIAFGFGLKNANSQCACAIPNGKPLRSFPGIAVL